MWVKGIDGVLEISGAVLLFVIGKAGLRAAVLALTAHELSSEPGDWFASHLRQAVSHLASNTTVFAGVYLLGHGLIKVVLVWWGLLRKKRWAFPTAEVFLGLFIAYQAYRMTLRFSALILALTLLDCAVLFLIWRESKTVARVRPFRFP